MDRRPFLPFFLSSAFTHLWEATVLFPVLDERFDVWTFERTGRMGLSEWFDRIGLWDRRSERGRLGCFVLSPAPISSSSFRAVLIRNNHLLTFYFFPWSTTRELVWGWDLFVWDISSLRLVIYGEMVWFDGRAVEVCLFKKSKTIKIQMVEDRAHVAFFLRRGEIDTVSGGKDEYCLETGRSEDA